MRKAGRPINRSVIEEVLKHIPEDTDPIRHKDLMELCKKDGMAYETLRRTLKYLEKLGIVEKEAVKSERGAGTQYHRTIGLPSFEKETERLKAQPNTAYASPEFTEKGISMERLRSETDFLMYYGVYPEIQKYIDNPDREKAKARLNTVLKDVITPWIIKRVDSAFPISKTSMKDIKDISIDDNQERELQEQIRKAEEEKEKYEKQLEEMKKEMGYHMVEGITSDGRHYSYPILDEEKYKKFCEKRIQSKQK